MVYNLWDAWLRLLVPNLFVARDHVPRLEVGSVRQCWITMSKSPLGVPCYNKCMPVGGVCCADGTGYCPAGSYCVIGTNGIPGCCLNFHICHGPAPVATTILSWTNTPGPQLSPTQSMFVKRHKQPPTPLQLRRWGRFDAAEQNLSLVFVFLFPCRFACVVIHFASFAKGEG